MLWAVFRLGSLEERRNRKSIAEKNSNPKPLLVSLKKLKSTIRMTQNNRNVSVGKNNNNT